MITAMITNIYPYGEGIRVIAEFSDDTARTLIFESGVTVETIKERVNEVKAEKEALLAKVGDLSSELLNIEI